MKNLVSGILSAVGNLSSLFGGIFSALQFFAQKSTKKNRKIVWQVYQIGSLRVTKFTFKNSERV